jgi:predicted ATPase with chaperone activity
VFHQEITPSSAAMSAPIDDEAVREKKQSLLDRQNFAVLHFGEIPSELSVRWLEKNLPLDGAFEKMLRERTTSLRSRHKAMRLARTIQAVALSKEAKIEYLFEALSFRF